MDYDHLVQVQEWSTPNTQSCDLFTAPASSSLLICTNRECYQQSEQDWGFTMGRSTLDSTHPAKNKMIPDRTQTSKLSITTLATKRNDLLCWRAFLKSNILFSTWGVHSTGFDSCPYSTNSRISHSTTACALIICSHILFIRVLVRLLPLTEWRLDVWLLRNLLYEMRGSESG